MNFVFFIPDELRAESVGCYGHPSVSTPNMDRLAAEGTRFDQCHVQHTVCSPSRCSFMTGWYPHVRGHRTLWHLLRHDEPNLLKYLKAAGYHVYWGGKNDLLAPESFAASVDDYRLGDRATRAAARPAGHRLAPPYERDDPRYYSFLYPPLAERIEQLPDFRQVDGAIELLRSRPQEPFVIYLPLTFPHCPYWAPPGWHDRIDPADIPPLRPADLPDKPDFYTLIRQTRHLDRLDEAALRLINATYLGMAGVSDYLLGELLDALDMTGHAEDTAVFCFSDHGDWAGDYGLVEKWPSGLDDTLTRVPFIARVPGGTRGHVVKEPVELFDFLPTVLELAEVPARHTHFARSLAPQLAGATGDPTRAVFAEGGYDPHEPYCFEGHPGGDQALRDPSHIYYPKTRLQQDVPDSVCRATMIRTATHKLVQRPRGVSELYDLRADPQELHNLHGQSAHAGVRHELECRLLDWYVRTSDVTPFDENPRGLPSRE
jgi:arylsulfatase A-like enzyme